MAKQDLTVFVSGMDDIKGSRKYRIGVRYGYGLFDQEPCQRTVRIDSSTVPFSNADVLAR
jgi:hypothetical protein